MRKLPTSRTHLIRLALPLLIALFSMPQAVAAQQQATHVFELRTYTSTEGRLDDVVNRFRDDSMRLLAEHGVVSIGYWIPQDPESSGNTLTYLLQHPSREAARANWQAFFQDDEWLAVRARTEANGPIVAKVVSIFMDPTEFSPLR